MNQTSKDSDQLSELNPYKPVLVDATVTPMAEGDFPLASRWQRFAGNFIDSILLAIMAIIPYTCLLIAYGMIVDPSYFETDQIGPRHMQDFLVETILALICIAGAFLLLNGYLIAKRGQTIGKLLMKTKMIGDDNQLVPLQRIFLMRYCWLWCVNFIPVIGPIIGIVDALTIFGEDKKCIHDKMASTKVISIR